MEQLESAGMRLQTQVKPALEEEFCYIVQGRGLPAKGPALTRSCWWVLPQGAAESSHSLPHLPPWDSLELLPESHLILTDTHKDHEVGFVSTFQRQPEAGEVGKLD